MKLSFSCWVPIESLAAFKQFTAFATEILPTNCLLMYFLNWMFQIFQPPYRTRGWNFTLWSVIGQFYCGVKQNRTWENFQGFPGCKNVIYNCWHYFGNFGNFLPITSANDLKIKEKVLVVKLHKVCENHHHHHHHHHWIMLVQEELFQKDNFCSNLKKAHFDLFLAVFTS